MEKEYQQNRIKDYMEDIADAEKDVQAAEVELKNAQNWLTKQKLYLAEAIIKLHKYQEEIK